MIKSPEWLRVKNYQTIQISKVKEVLAKYWLSTVCEEASCPNIIECFNRGTATFMILGRVCTRHCSFCNILKGDAEPVDVYEAIRIAKAVRELNIKHVVITSVTRDDLQDGGARHFANIVKHLRNSVDNIVIEVLVPDFLGSEEAIRCLVESRPDVIAHNIETVPRLYSRIRPKAMYERSIRLLEQVKEMDSTLFTKSGLIFGLGEGYQEVLRVMGDLASVECDVLTLGQYLRPTVNHHPVVEYLHPSMFERYEGMSDSMGFKCVFSGPLVRSSYRANEAIRVIKNRKG